MQQSAGHIRNMFQSGICVHFHPCFVAFLLIVWIIAHAPAKKYLKNDAAAHVSSKIWHVHIYIVILKVLIDPADEQT